MFPNLSAQSILKRRSSRQAFEDRRAEKRGKRGASVAAAPDPSRTASGPGTPGAIAPGEPGLKAPAPKMTKKEQKRQADLKASEAQQRESTNQSLRMAMGGGTLFGKKKKAPSWLTAKQGTPDSFVPPPSRKSAAAGGEQAPGAADAAGGPGVTAARGSKAGEFREDREDGSGIQMRDLVHLLEPDLREKKTLARAYNRMGFPFRRTR